MKQWPPPAIVKLKQDFTSEKPHEILGVSENATEEEIRAAKRRFALAKQKAIVGTDKTELETYKRINQAAAEMTKALKEKESLSGTPVPKGLGQETPEGVLEAVEVEKKKRKANQEPLQITHEATPVDAVPVPDKKVRKSRSEPVQTPEVITLGGPETPDNEIELTSTQIPAEDLVDFSKKETPISPEELVQDEMLAAAVSTPSVSDSHWDPITREEGPSVEERRMHERRESAQVLDKKLRNITDEWAGYEPENGRSPEMNRPEPGIGPTVEERLAYELAQQGSEEVLTKTSSETIRTSLEQMAIPRHENTSAGESKETVPYRSIPPEKKGTESPHGKSHEKGHHGDHKHGKPFAQRIFPGAIGGAGALIILFIIKAIEFGRGVWGSLLSALGFKGKKKEKPATAKPAAAHDHH